MGLEIRARTAQKLIDATLQKRTMVARLSVTSAPSQDQDNLVNLRQTWFRAARRDEQRGIWPLSNPRGRLGAQVGSVSVFGGGEASSQYIFRPPLLFCPSIPWCNAPILERVGTTDTTYAEVILDLILLSKGMLCR